MSYGFYCKNGNNITQIDENYSNFAIHSFGSGVTGPAPIHPSRRLFISLTSNNWFWLVDTGSLPNINQGFGLNVYKENGEAVFCSNFSYPWFRGCYGVATTDSFSTYLAPPNSPNNLYYDATANVIVGDWSAYDTESRYFNGTFKFGVYYENSTLFIDSDYNYIQSQLSGSLWTGGSFIVNEIIYITIMEF
jgi:hypothetical protein